MQSRNFRSNAFQNRVASSTKRSGSPDSSDSSSIGSEKLTKDQHICIQNLGMASAFFLPVALVVGAVAIGTNYWFNVGGDYVGLFQYCNNWTQSCASMSDKYRNDSFMKSIWEIAVPLELVGASFLVFGMATLLCYPCHRKVNFSKIACGVIVGIISLIGMLAFLGGTGLFTYYYLKEKPEMLWSFYLNAIAAGFAFIATILFWVHIFYTGCFDA